MKKLAELNVDEMTLLMCRVAEPAGNLFADGAVIAAFVDVAKVLQEANFRLAGIAYFASKIIPILRPRSSLFCWAMHTRRIRLLSLLLLMVALWMSCASRTA